MFHGSTSTQTITPITPQGNPPITYPYLTRSAISTHTAKPKHYEIIKLIGESAMGELYLATDTILGRRVALRVLLNFGVEIRTIATFFTQEARTASRLSHPSVCVVHEISETDRIRKIFIQECETKTKG